MVVLEIKVSPRVKFSDGVGGWAGWGEWISGRGERKVGWNQK